MTRRLLPLLALAAAACGGPPRDPGADAAPASPPEVRAAPAVDAVPDTAPPAGPTVEEARRAPQVLVTAIDSTSEETPVVSRALFPDGTPRTFVEGGVLYAPAALLLRAVAPAARVGVEGERVTVDGRALQAPVRLRDGEAFVAVREAARGLRAYAHFNEVDGSVAIWPRDVLLYWREHGDPASPAVQAAVREGVLEP